MVKEVSQKGEGEGAKDSNLLFCIMPFSTFALHMDSIVDCAQAHCVKKD